MGWIGQLSANAIWFTLRKRKISNVVAARLPPNVAGQSLNASFAALAWLDFDHSGIDQTVEGAAKGGISCDGHFIGRPRIGDVTPVGAKSDRTNTELIVEFDDWCIQSIEEERALNEWARQEVATTARIFSLF